MNFQIMFYDTVINPTNYALHNVIMIMKIYNFPSFMHWLLIVNASTNFLIYCFMGNKFKTVLMSMVRDLVKGKEQATSMVMMVDASGVKRDISKVSIKLASSHDR